VPSWLAGRATREDSGGTRHAPSASARGNMRDTNSGLPGFGGTRAHRELATEKVREQEVFGLRPPTTVAGWPADEVASGARTWRTAPATATYLAGWLPGRARVRPRKSEKKAVWTRARWPYLRVAIGGRTRSFTRRRGSFEPGRSRRSNGWVDRVHASGPGPVQC
jgi:hypothetical protein